MQFSSTTSFYPSSRPANVREHVSCAGSGLESGSVDGEVPSDFADPHPTKEAGSGAHAPDVASFVRRVLSAVFCRLLRVSLSLSFSFSLAVTFSFRLRGSAPAVPARLGLAIYLLDPISCGYSSLHLSGPLSCVGQRFYLLSDKV